MQRPTPKHPYHSIICPECRRQVRYFHSPKDRKHGIAAHDILAGERCPGTGKVVPCEDRAETEI